MDNIHIKECADSPNGLHCWHTLAWHDASLNYYVYNSTSCKRVCCWCGTEKPPAHGPHAPYNPGPIVTWGTYNNQPGADNLS